MRDPANHDRVSNTLQEDRPDSPEVQADVAALDLTRPDLPSIGVSGDIRVRPEQRKAFLDELQQTLQDLFTRYGGAEGDAFRLAVACYPKGDPDDRA